MRFLRATMLALGLMSFAACGGGQKKVEEPAMNDGDMAADPAAVDSDMSDDTMDDATDDAMDDDMGDDMGDDSDIE